MKPLPRRLVILLAAFSAAAAARADGIAWGGWSEDAFAQARREHKFVLLDLEAVWCHWCHVMDATTYRDPSIVALVGSRYVAIRVDQDSRPDLANRYEDYGWPATIIYAPDGTEIVKKQGYVEPAAMARLLRAVIDDPSPVNYGDGAAEAAGPAPTGELAPERRAALRSRWLAGYDDAGGGWGADHKFLDWDTVEYALREAARGDRLAAHRARETLRLQRGLLDPVWGGMYQYSVGGGWDQPHFEKIMPMQAEDLRIYSLAFAQDGDPADLATAQAIRRYLRSFLTSPDGAFYASQDADRVPGEHGAGYFALDDAGRRARGIPRVDRHVYARENGWAIAALAQFSAVTGDLSARREAETAARWVIAHRALPGGGFRHDERDPAGPYLGDSLAMGRAFLALHQLSADPAWLDRASAAADFIKAHFDRKDGPGFAASDTSRPSFLAPRAQFDENVELARFATALAGASGRAEFRGIATSALRWLIAPGVADRRGFYVGGLLLAEEEARTDPLHVAIVGGKGDPAAGSLYAEALRAPTAHKLIEWWDRRDGAAPRGEDIYPDLPRAAAFVCANGACSSPIFAAPALAVRLARILSIPPTSESP
jgi:uncharacterized protein YyaL (SSP411 family)